MHLKCLIYFAFDVSLQVSVCCFVRSCCQGRLVKLKASWKQTLKTAQTQTIPERYASKARASRGSLRVFFLARPPLQFSVFSFLYPQKTIMNSSFSTLKIFVKKITFYVHCMQQSRSGAELRKSFSWESTNKNIFLLSHPLLAFSFQTLKCTCGL